MGEIKLLSHPEVKPLFDKFIENLFVESGRGALLLATAFIEDQLDSLIRVFIPNSLSEGKRKELFKAGFLSSFNAKLEFCYLSRLISMGQYQSLNQLRKIRNDAAHREGNFDLHMLNDTLSKVYSFANGSRDDIRSMAIDILHEYKLIPTKELIFKNAVELSDEQKDKEFLELLNEKSTIEILERKFPFYELSVGLTYICAVIIHQREQIAAKITDDKLIISLVKDVKDS